MKSITVSLLIIGLLAICIAMANANSVGITYSQVVDDTSWGAVANLDGNITDGVDAELDLQLQGGEIIKGRYSTELKVGFLGIFHNGNIKGTSLDGLGNELDIGARGVVNIQGLDVSVGVFARNASEFAGQTAHSVLVDKGFDEDALPAGLDTISPPPSGLKIIPGSSLNVLFGTSVDLGMFDCSLKVMPQLTGDVKAHQSLLTAQTDVKLSENIDLILGGEIVFQAVDGEIDYETSSLATLEFNF